MHRRGIGAAIGLVVAGLLAIAVPAGASASGAAVPAAVAAARLIPGARGTAATSPNWSGYVALDAKPFTEASGTWTQPATSCAGDTHSVAAFWVGLDGYQNDTVEQTGVQAACTGGAVSYFAWWQMWPAPVTDLPTSTYPVRPGDTVAASVTRSGQQYTLSLDSSAGWHYSTVQSSPSAAASSAEWVASSPRLCHTCRFALLSDFGAVTFSGVEAAAGGTPQPLGTFGHGGGPVALTMVNAGGVTRASPGPIVGHRQSFTVTWTHA